MAMNMDRLTPGFENPVRESQRTFRKILEAMAHPGRVVSLEDFPLERPLPPPAPLNVGAASVLLALVDFETVLWSDLAANSPALEWLRFHCGCSTSGQARAGDFALITKPFVLPPLDLFRVGDDQYPELSATVIFQADMLSAGTSRRLSGPGIRDFCLLEAGGLPEDFWDWRKKQAIIYPLGIDIIFASADRIAALPRTTIVED